MAGLMDSLNRSNKTTTGGRGLMDSLVTAQKTNNAITNANPQVLAPTANAEASQNNGGFLGGLGYLGEKIGLGFLSGIEGIWDYTAGGFAKLFGADDWAEQQFANDWVNYNHADEWYNPSDGWKVAGDVAGGIGTSLPALVGAGIGAGIAYFSGGSLSPLATKIITASLSSLAAGLGAAGNATKEAYRETGELGGKEFGYGALTGATEAGVELLSAGMAKGSGRIVSSIAKSTSKEVTETVAKTGARTIFKQLGEDFVSEAFEEGLSELVSPVYQMMTYNPDAKNATVQEVGYAALVGGLAGMVMSGSSIGINSGVNSTVNYFSGKKAAESGTYAGVIEAGRALADAEGKNDTNIEAFQSAQDTYNKLTESLKKNNGISTTEELLERVKAGTVTFKAKDLMYLGKLKRTSVIAHLHPYIERSARGLVFSADVAAERYSTFGITDANGKPLNFTAEQLLEGIDTELLTKAKEGALTDKEARTFALSLRKAIQNNPVLSTLAVAEATGQIMLDTRKMAEALLNGQNLANAADLNYLIENGKPEEMQALGQALGIEDWSKVTIDELRTRVAEFNANGGISEFAEQSKRMRRALEQGAENAKPLPHLLRKNMQDGVYRYTSEDGSVNMAIFKEADTYRLYDYDGDNISRALSVQDVNQVLKRFWTSGRTTTAKSMQNNQENTTSMATAEIEALAKEAVGENYNKLNEPTKAAIRMTIRQARAHGLSDVQVRTFAKVAARTGVNIIFDVQKALGDGSYSARDNAIYVNPKNSAERTYEIILGHEMFHAIFANGEKGALSLFLEAKKLIDNETAEKTRSRYKGFYDQVGGVSATQANVIAEEEVAARGVEEAFKSEKVWDYILSKEPSFADKVLSFFRQSAREYSELQGMSSQARKFIRQYKKLFDSLSEKHQGTNALALTLEGANAKKMPITNTNDENVQVTGDNDEDNETLEGDDGTRLAIKHPSFREEEITSNMDAIADMEAVATIDASKLEKTGKKPFDLFLEYFDALGNNISSSTFGDIALNRASVKSEIRHGITAEKVASLEAIPAVIEQGKVIFSKKKPGTDVDRVVIAAPIKISNTDYYMGVMLQRDTQNQRLYLHNVVAIKAEEATTLSQDDSLTNWSDESDSRLFITSILQKAINVKAEKQKSAIKPSETSSGSRFALPETDSNGETLTEAQREYFADSKVLDENGNLLALYHGTPKENGEFYVFDNNKAKRKGGFGFASSGKGFYFTTKREAAEIYTRSGGRLLSVYVDIKNPYIVNGDIKEQISNDFGIDPLNVYLQEVRRILSSKGYDGIIQGKGDARIVVAYYPEQIKLTSNKNPTADPDVRFALPETDSEGNSLSPEQREFFAESQIRAVEKDGYVEISPDGSLLPVYHGTNSGEFYEFDKKLIGSANDSGWYGRGFYFAFSEYEAGMYGKNVLKCYLNIKKPFNFSAEMQAYDGIEDGDVYFDFASFVINMARKFPEIAKTLKVEVVDRFDGEGNAEGSQSKNFLDLAHEIESIYNSERLTIESIYDGDTEYFGYKVSDNVAELDIPAEIKKIIKDEYITSASWASYLLKDGTITKEQYDGILDAMLEHGEHNFESYYIHGRFKTREQAEKYRLSAAITYLSDKRYSYIEQHLPEYFMQRVGRQFNEELRRRGYDGVIQSTTGDEIVAFEANQIKLVSNEAPTSAPDIRYALPENDSTGAELTSDISQFRNALSDTDGVDNNGKKGYNYSKEQYESFGWASEAGCITTEELDDLFAKIQARTTLRTFRQSSKGEAIIEVNNDPHKTLGVDNVFVFVKGKKDNFRITRTVRFNAETETEMDIVRRELYEGRTWSDSYCAFLSQEGLAKEYRRENTESFEQYNQEVRRRSLGQTSRGTYQDNRGRTKYRSGYSLTVGEDGEILERFALTGDENLEDIFAELASFSDSGHAFDIQKVIDRGLPRRPGASTLTVGELKKVIANNTRDKVYSKKNALEIVSRFYGVSDLTAKTRGEIADALWQGLNDCTDAEERATFAHDMAEFIVAKMLTEAKVENPDIIEAQEKLTYLSTYIGKLTFSPQDISELRHIADKDVLRRLLGRWGYKGRKISLGNGTATVARATPMDVFVCDIAREMPGMADFEDMHPAEAFMELDAIYERAKEDVKDKWVSAYWDMPDSDIPAMVQGVEQEILKAFMTEGAKSKFAKLVEGKIESAQRRADFWKAEHDRIKGRDRLLGILMAQTYKLGDIVVGKYKNSTQTDNDLFRGSIGELAKIKWRGSLKNVNRVREIFAGLLSWYQGSQKTLLEYVDAENPGYYSEAIEEALRTIAEGQGGFTKTDLSTMIDVMGHFIHFVENYGKVWRSGQMVEALPLAQEYNRIIERNKTLKVGLFGKLAGSWYAELFLDPQALCERMDYYDHGFFTQMFEELRAAAKGADVAEMDIMTEYDAFLRENKKYIANISTETVEYRGHQIPKAQLIDLYMTMKRKQAWAGAAYNGFNFKNLKGDVERVDGFLTAEVETEEELDAAIQAELDAIAKNFTDTDRAYMAIVERGYNERAKALKVERDMARMGYTNASYGYYYPISRAYTSKTIDADPVKAEFDRVSNASFNKDIVKGARQELALSSVDARYRRHIHAVCQYAYLQPAIETFNRLYNLDISGNKNHPVNVRTATENLWKVGRMKQGAANYFKKLISDIQGISTGSSEGMAALAFIRGSYAKYQLGANPKVWFTQLSSIFASTSILDYDCILKGMGVSSSDIDTYCPLARLRNYDNTAAMAQGVLDRSGKAYGRTGKVMNKVGKVSDLLMKPIGMMDRFVVSRLFGACQVQVEKNGGAKVGTEENKIEAGKLLERVIFETQQNSIATERSGAMRSSNEIYRTLTMFTSDSMKVMGRVISAYGEVSVLKARIKAETDVDAKAELQARLKKAQKKLAKSSTALAMTAIFMALIAQAFRWLYKKDDEEDNIPLNITLDAVGNLFGGLPLVKDAYAKLIEGYDLDNYAYSAVNDLLDGAKNLMTTAGNVFSNEASSQEVALGIKNFVYSIGQATGIPVRNIYNVFYGLTKRFNGQAAYKIDNVFYEKNYKNDFYKAIESGDIEMATFIMSRLYNERMGENMSATTHSELYSLSAKGYKVIPKSVASSITIDGQEYELSEAEIAALRANYSTAQSGLDKLFANASYSALTDELKAEAVNYLYDLYYDQAIEETLGVDRGNGALVAKAVGADTLALLYVATKGLESDKDKNGNVISGSKRKKVLAAIKKLNIQTQQKLLLLCAKGYAIQDGDIKGYSAEQAKKYLLNYLLRLTSLTKEQKAELAALCGFEVKNGKIVQKTSTKQNKWRQLAVKSVL